ncbi:ATP-binding protein [Streptomyces sp. NPDC020412]|uniref:ATP-binding protein n=1 Tax=Streptomyces sp. NPDC020412 TaxID=3365073 RepID=UPI0037B8F2D0
MTKRPDLRHVPPYVFRPAQRGVIALPGDNLRSVGVARHAVQDTLGKWHVADDMIYRAAYITDELVANAVEHTRSVSVSVAIVRRADGVVTVAVSDEGHPGQLSVHQAAPTDEGGRGLAIVAALSRRWTHRRSVLGSCITAEIHPSDDPSEGIDDSL